MTESMQWSGALAGASSMGADPSRPVRRRSPEQFHEQILPAWIDFKKDILPLRRSSAGSRRDRRADK
jgi:hypothetical protein